MFKARTKSGSSIQNWKGKKKAFDFAYTITKDYRFKDSGSYLFPLIVKINLK